jgi:hypothetical protein
MRASAGIICYRVSMPVLCIIIAACSGGGYAKTDSSSAGGNVASSDSAATGNAAAATTMVRGTIASVSDTAIAVQTDGGTTTVRITQPLRIYDRQPAQLADVTPNTFIGVTTVKQPDGSERATEIHIFPEELRGLGEGSRPMAPQASNGATPSTMTNGSASSTMTNGSAAAPATGSTTGNTTGSTMTNGSASSATMSNGTASTNGKALVVQYAGGTMKATVPANTPVMKIVAVSKPLTTGERVVVVATKGTDGSLASNRVMLAR